MQLSANARDALERYREFIKNEAVAGSLKRSLSLAAPNNVPISSVITDDSLRCTTESGSIIIGGTEYMLRPDFSGPHWFAILKVLFMQELQHDSSSDKAVLTKFVKSGAELLRLEPELGELISQRLLNITEEARIDNIICRRFPGYIPMLRFTCYARLDAYTEAPGALAALFRELEIFSLTGMSAPDGQLDTEAKALIDRAILCESAAGCAELCLELLSHISRLISELCAINDDSIAELRAGIRDYAFSEADRAEQHGDGCDSRLRRRSSPETERSGTPDSGSDADGDKGDTGSSGSGDNSERFGDMSGSLTDRQARPHGSAGTNGREDRGQSSSAGRSTNHGQSSSCGITSDNASALAKAGLEGPESIREVIGTGWSARRGFALTGAELDAMLKTAERELRREEQLEKKLRVQAPYAARLDRGDRSMLSEQYPDVDFTESYIVPRGGRLPPEFAERAKAMHLRLDKLLRQQHERNSSQRTGALSQRELWKIPLDSKDIFRRRSPPSKRETAFYLLIDRSGSMGTGVGGGKSKLFTALITAAMIEEALKGVAYTKIVAFDGGTNAVEHCVIKDFDQKELGNRCMDALTQISAGNGNKDGFSIRTAAMDIDKRSERRKILMVLSDGLPSGYFSESEAIADVRSAVQAARRKGIIVIPVIYSARSGESFDAYRQMYEKSIIYADSANILGEFERLLIKLIR